MLKERNLGELLDLTIRLYFGNIRLLLSLSAIMILPSLAFAFNLLFGQLLLSIPLYLVSILVSTLVLGALTKAAAEAYLENEITFEGAFGWARGRFFPLILGSVLYIGALVIGMVLLVVPGIYLSVALSMYSEIIIVERLSAWSAVKRSRKLVRGSWWRVLGIFFVFIFLVGIVQYLFLTPLMILFFIVSATSANLADLMTFFTQAASTVISAAVSPLLIIGMTLLYFDLRIRKEGFDLAVKAEELVEETTPVT